MRFTRLPIATLALAAALTACSGDDSEPKNDDPSTSEATDDPNAPGTEARGACAVEVTVDGAVTAAWEGRGSARVGDTDGPQAIYKSVKGKNTLMAYSEGPDFPPSVTVTVGKRTFANKPGSATGLEIGTDRKSAQIDITAFDVEGKEADVVASFDCTGGKQDKQEKKGKNDGKGTKDEKGKG